MDVVAETRADTPEPVPTSAGTSKPSRTSGNKDVLLRRTKSKSYKNVFKGSVLVSTLMDHDNSRFSNRAAAVGFAQRLLDAGHIESIVGADEFEDSVHLFRWSDETVVREAKKMVSTLSSHIPRKKLIELVDMKRGEEGEEGFVMQDVKDKLVERSRPSSSRGGPGRSRGRRRQTIDSSQLAESQEPENGALMFSNSVSSENLSEVPESTLQRRTSSMTSSSEILSSPRVGNSPSVSDSCQTDTEKVRSPDRVRSPAAARSPTRRRSPERPGAPAGGAPNGGEGRDDGSAAGNQSDDGTSPENQEGHSATATTMADEGDVSEGQVVRYDGVEMPALDLENLDFHSVRSLSNAADALSVLDPSLESLSEQGNCYSDNEKQLLEQMRRMQQEHASAVTSYEQQINDLMAKVTELKDLAEVLQKQRQEADSKDTEEKATNDNNADVASPNSHTLKTTKPPPKAPAPPAPPPLLLGQNTMRLVKPSKPAIKPRVKMRPLFWNRIILERNQEGKENNKVATFWMSATEPNFNVDEFERYFGKSAEEDNPRVRSLHDAMAAAKGRGALKECVKILDDSRSRAVAIKLRSLHCQMADIQAALYSMDFTKLDTDSLFSLYEIRGTKEEIDKISTYMQAHENAVLDEPELFVWELSSMPHFPERVECLMLRKRFNETLFDIDQQLTQVRSAAEALRSNDHLRVVLEVILAFGNYMNGGTQRGQADGYDLSILPKLKDVKSMDNNLTLLHYLVRVCTREYEAEDAGRNEARFRFPDPAIISGAANVSFVDLDADLNNLGFQVTTNAKKAELIYLDTKAELLQPFKDQMDDFFETADDMLKAQQGKLNEAREDFHRLLRYLSVKDATEQVGPEQFFGMWYRFIEDYREYWMLEQKRIAKQMFEKVEQRRKARIRSAKRRQSANDGKANMKQKFEQIRRRSENLAGNSQPTVKLLRSQSASGETNPGQPGEDSGPRSAPPHSDERPRRRRRQTADATEVARDGAVVSGRDPVAVVHTDAAPQNETMAQRMQRRRRTRVSTSTDDPAGEGRPRARAQSEDLSRSNDRRVQPDSHEEHAVSRRRLRAGSADVKPPLPDSGTPKAEVGEGATQRRRRPGGRNDLPEGGAEVSAEGSSFATRRQMYREQRLSSEGGGPATREPRTRPVMDRQSGEGLDRRGAREHMRRIADRGHDSVRKADLLNRS